MIMATRKAFDEDTFDAPVATDNKPFTYRCSAMGCRLTGAISSEAGKNLCAQHYGHIFEDFGKVTEIIQDWNCITREIARGRSFMNTTASMKPALVEQAFAEAYSRLSELTANSEWAESLQPQATRSGKLDDYPSWILRLENVLTKIVERSLSRKRRELAGDPA